MPSHDDAEAGLAARAPKPAPPASGATRDHAAWLALVVEEPVDARQRIVDAHHHLWPAVETAGAARYLAEDLLADMASGHHVVGSVYVEAGHVRREPDPDGRRAIADTAFAAAEARRIAASASPILAIVAHGDLADAALPAMLEGHADAGAGLFRGVRHITAALPDARTGAMPGIMATDAFRRGVAHLGANDLSYDAFVFHTQLPELAAVAHAAPDTRIVVNHLGVPMDFGDGGARDGLIATWRAGLRAIAACPNVVLKLGGVGMERMSGARWAEGARPPTSDAIVARWGDDIRRCIDTLGPERCMFESNYPVDHDAFGYTVIWNAYQKIAGSYDETERDALFAGTAEAAYRLRPARPS